MTSLLGRRAFLACASALAAASAFPAPAAPQGRARPGRIETLDSLGSADLPQTRVRVWLPTGYPDGAGRYRTLYMLDGQYAFSGDLDGVNFAADRRLASLASAGRIQPTLIVAIDSPEDPVDRFRHYMPQPIYDQSTGELRAAIERAGGGRPLMSAPFIRYLTTRLKPYIDARHRTLAGPLDTAILGASMAGPMAAALFVESQQAFGRAACMSPNWPIYDARFIEHAHLLSLWPGYFARLGAPAGRRLWLDHGTLMLDAGMAPHQIGIVRRLERLGWRRGRDLEARVHQGAGHAFAQTAVQMDGLLAWLLA